MALAMNDVIDERRRSVTRRDIVAMFPPLCQDHHRARHIAIASYLIASHLIASHGFSHKSAPQLLLRQGTSIERGDPDASLEIELFSSSPVLFSSSALPSRCIQSVCVCEGDARVPTWCFFCTVK